MTKPLTKPLKPLPNYLFLFTRDLRINDNTALIKLSNIDGESAIISPMFIFTPEQTLDNKMFSDKSFAFLLSAVGNLDSEIKKQGGAGISCFYGDVKKIITKIEFKRLAFMRDYTPYAIERSNQLAEFNPIICDDVLLSGDISAVQVYKIFNRYYNSAKLVPVRQVNKTCIKFSEKLLDGAQTFERMQAQMQTHAHAPVHAPVHATREAALNCLKIKNYTPNNLETDTTHLSVYNKYGIISIREVYAYAQAHEHTLPTEFIRQLYWRDFYYQFCYHFPAIFNYEYMRKGRITNIKWPANPANAANFRAWCTGKTGFPIVDAAMRQLNETGWVHGRARLIAAEFFCKDLLLEWRLGEQYFSRKLLDIDRCQNIGNWNWCASFGLDASPFTRIFNPWRQTIDHDSNFLYIKKWIPELRDIHINILKRLPGKLISGYPAPIVDHASARERYLEWSRSLKDSSVSLSS